MEYPKTRIDQIHLGQMAKIQVNGRTAKGGKNISSVVWQCKIVRAKISFYNYVALHRDEVITIGSAKRNIKFNDFNIYIINYYTK